MPFPRLLLSVLLLGSAVSLPNPARAQTDAMAPKRALNLARDTAVRLNGGLSKYRPARCMHQSITNNPCLAQRDADGFVFHFPGGHPGWQEAGTPPSQVTVLRVSADGRAITQTIHNGPLAVSAPQVQEFNR